MTWFIVFAVWLAYRYGYIKCIPDVQIHIDISRDNTGTCIIFILLNSRVYIIYDTESPRGNYCNFTILIYKRSDPPEKHSTPTVYACCVHIPRPL